MHCRRTSIFAWILHYLMFGVTSLLEKRSNICVDPLIRLDNGGSIQSHKEFSLKPYSNNMDCDWLIKAPPDNQIMIQFNFINIEKDAQCNFDYVEFVTLEEGIARVCGDDDKRRYLSQGNKLIVKFHTDKAITMEGFYLRYWFVDNRTVDFPSTKFGRACSVDEWECLDENSCLPKEWVCDRIQDCRDHSDEDSCDRKRTCRPSQVTCNSGQCVSKEQSCDFYPDCDDSSDEFSCIDFSKIVTITDTPTDAHRCSFQPIKPNGINVTDNNAQIVGGQEVVQGSWPWMASLRFGSSHYCGATLISKSWAVTAAHCFENSARPEIWRLDLGRHYANDRVFSERIQVDKVVIHPLYNSGTIENDVALLKLSKNVTLTSKIQTLCLPTTSKEPSAGQRCVILGWGATQSTGAEGVLRQAVLPIVDRGKCNAYYKSILDGMICAGYEEGGVDSCQQDSGGPLICDNNGHFALYGITSWGEGCALPHRPGVYTNVVKYVNWIKDHVKDFDNNM